MTIRTVSQIFILAIVLISTTACPGQQALEKRPLEHADYDQWQTMNGYGLSDNGRWAWLLAQNGAIDGEATLTIRNLKSGKQYRVPRGTRSRFTPDSRFAMYRITPDKKKLKQPPAGDSKSSKTETKKAAGQPLLLINLDTGVR